MQTKGKDDHPFVSIPAYPNRKFRLQYIFVNNKAGIESPRDLEGFLDWFVDDGRAQR